MPGLFSLAGAYSQVVKRQTREAQNLVPTGREGSTPSLATVRPRSVTEARDASNVEDGVRLLTGILMPAKLDRPSAALVKRRTWVRLPPLAGLRGARSAKRKARPDNLFALCAPRSNALTFSGVAQLVRASA